EEKIQAVELAYIADPVRLEDGFAARDGQSVKRSDRALRIFLEIVKKRRLKTILNAFQHRKMQLENLLHRVEDSAHDIGLGPARQFLDPLVGDQVKVEFRTDALQRLRKLQSGVRAVLRSYRRCQRAQHGRIVPGSIRKALVDDDGRDMRIEHRSA